MLAFGPGSRARMRAQRHLRRFMLAIVLAGVIGLGIYLALAGRTASWPSVPCSVVNSRVVRADVPVAGFRVVIVYKGQFQLRYVVADREYFIWTDTAWVDNDPAFIEGKVASHREDQCEYLIRYNPKNPAEAVATLQLSR